MASIHRFTVRYSGRAQAAQFLRVTSQPNPSSSGPIIVFVSGKEHPMPLYLYGSSALDAMRYTRSIEGGILPGTAVRPRHLGNAIHTHRQINELGDDAQRLLSHIRTPIQVLVPKRSMTTQSDRLITHVWSHDIPSGAYLRLDNGIYLPTPAFLMQQLASQLDEIGLILLGLELCGFYSMWSFPAMGAHHATADEFEGCTFELNPATSVTQLTSYIRKRGGERGYRTVQHVLKRTLDRSASPMESVVYLLLCLPRRLGGFGLPMPVLNVKVKVSTSTTTKSRFPDLYWPIQSLDVEYDSDQDHTGMWSRYRDARRTVELAAEKITVLPLTHAQLFDAGEFEAFAASVRRNLGIRARTLDAEWHAKHHLLRERLLLSGAEPL